MKIVLTSNSQKGLGFENHWLKWVKCYDNTPGHVSSRQAPKTDVKSSCDIFPTLSTSVGCSHPKTTLLLSHSFYNVTPHTSLPGHGGFTGNSALLLFLNPDHPQAWKDSRLRAVISKCASNIVGHSPEHDGSWLCFWLATIIWCVIKVF